MHPNDTTNEIPYGYCHCGCGQKTKLAPRTHSRKGLVKGQPQRFIDGHQSRLANFNNPNPSGLCMCGCGEKTSIAPCTSKDKGWVRGKPLRFVAGHFARTQPEKPLSDANERFWARVDKNGPVHPALQTPCWLWTGGLNKYGYGKTSAGKKHIGAHRLSWMLTNGAIQDGLNVLHHCDNPKCVNPQHLYLGSHADNHRDMIARNRIVGRKLLAKDVQNIRLLRANGKSYKAIGDMYAVSATTASQVVKRNRYSEVE